MINAVAAVIVAMGLVGQPADTTDPRNSVIYANAVKTDMRDLPCYEDEDMWRPGTLKFEDVGSEQRDASTVQRSAPPGNGVDCAVA